MPLLDECNIGKGFGRKCPRLKEILSLHLSGGTKESHEKLKSEYTGSGP
jgi:hypothetical protein